MDEATTSQMSWIKPEAMNQGELDALFSKYPIYLPTGSDDFWSNSAVVLETISSVEEPNAPPSSWASLFAKNQKSAKGNPNIYSEDKSIKPLKTTNVPKKPKKKSLKEVLQTWKVKPSERVPVPRGLVNSGNMCFMNVVLQTLVYCKYFSNLLQLYIINRITFLSEFQVLPSTPNGIENNEPFVPEYVYNALRKKKIFQTSRGQQEDAQEFLGHLLNGIHDELLNIMYSETNEESGVAQDSSSANQKGFNSGEKVSDVVYYEDIVKTGEEEWLEVGKKNKTSTSREVLNSESPITFIFGCQLRSELKKSGSKPSFTKEPYQFLTLDISNSDIVFLEDAIDQLLSVETIEGFTSASFGVYFKQSTIFYGFWR
ncbi:hypothetical protein BB560_001110 [Smittium megazygosporum]|uniref:ubiquitinyl hydrolase 1 n=1 Tax=Smittium megazygosporum TaxID=133381 RepID=A0A2T9ZIF3_9FUNG|nr:hypothetical protein BB560_001110 [Smittium megazygosporum]